MTDHDDRLTALFREAASTTAPPPAFDHDAVVTRSRKVTARRRSALLGGAMALLVVAGVGTAVSLPLGDDAGSTAAAPASAPEAERAGDAAGGAPAPAAPYVSSPEADSSAPDALQGVAPFTGVPLGPSPAECAPRQDPELRALVEQVLPEVAGAPEAAVTQECRPGGERGVDLEVDDAGATGLLTVEYRPPGGSADAGPGAVSATASTASGGMVVVRSQGSAPGAPVPFEGRLDTAAAFLAPRL